MTTFHELTVIDCSLLILFTEFITKNSADLKGLTKMQIINSFILWYNTDNNSMIQVNLAAFADVDFNKLVK